MGNTRVVLDKNGNTKAVYDYYPFGMNMRSVVSGTGARFKFTGKELDEGGGLDWYYFGARYYDASIGRFLGIDPLADAYPARTPYHNALNNPVVYFDLDGRSTVTDSAGNVINVNTQDNDLSVYQATTEQGGTNEFGIAGGPMSVKNKVGETYTLNALEEGDIVNIGSNEATTLFITSFYKHLITTDGLLDLAAVVEYMSNAGNGGIYDIKHNKPAGVATLLFGKYATHRQAGNTLAGYVASYHGLSFEASMRGFGAYQLAGNDIGVKMAYYFLNNPGPPYYGERPKSSQYQQIGWRLNR